jgi:hypothetical protein
VPDYIIFDETTGAISFNNYAASPDIRLTMRMIVTSDNRLALYE